MTPETIRKAAQTLAGEVDTRTDAQARGAAFGRALAAQLRAREQLQEQAFRASAHEVEMALLQLAASSNEFVAEIADNALQEMRHEQSARPRR